MEAARSKFALRLLPSLTDFAFLMPMAFLFGRMDGVKTLLSDCDTGWHIRTGEWILAHRQAPTSDIFSFSKPGAPWYAWEWLSDVLSACLFRLAGLKGIVLAAGVVIALFATTLVRRMIWRGVHLLVAMIVALLGVGSSTIHFLARPHIY